MTKSEAWDKAKFGPFLYSAKFGPVCSGSPENEMFYAATPGGQLDVSTISRDLFEPGKEYYLDITEVA